jgi:pimeloyl-ACP methyl ester carboxylesterase
MSSVSGRRATRAALAAVVAAGTLAQPALAADTGASASRAPALKMKLDDFEHARRTVQLPNGMTLGYAEFGDPKGRPVVLIHGYTDNARDWVPMIPFLAAGDRVIAVDIRGHGASGKPECCYALIDFAYDVKLLLDALGIEHADIVGHSLGSMIAQYFAEFWPNRTRRLVLISSTAGPLPGAPRKELMGSKPGVTFREEVLALKDPLDPESTFMRWWYDSPTPVDQEFLRRQRRDAAAIPVKVWIAVLDQGLMTVSLRSTLPRLKAPTLLIWGAKDFIFGAEDRAGLSTAVPAAQVIVYPDYGHNPFWENPQRVAKDIDAFLAQ